MQTVTAAQYAEDLWFQDPVARLKGRGGYIGNVRLMRTLFRITFVVHKAQPREPGGVDVWCAPACLSTDASPPCQTSVNEFVFYCIGKTLCSVVPTAVWSCDSLRAEASSSWDTRVPLAATFIGLKQALPLPQHRSHRHSTSTLLGRRLPRLYHTSEVAFMYQIAYNNLISRFILQSELVISVEKLTDGLVSQLTDGRWGCARWTMALKPRVPLWRPELTLTGRSRYEVDARGIITSHVDTWDAVADNSYLSVGPSCSHAS